MDAHRKWTTAPTGVDAASGATYARDTGRVNSLLSAATRKASCDRGSLADAWDDLTTLIQLVRAWASGRYTHAPWLTIVWTVGAIVYFVNPFDLIPDFIPGLGYVDDIAVVASVVDSVHDDIEMFRRWAQGRSARD